MLNAFQVSKDNLCSDVTKTSIAAPWEGCMTWIFGLYNKKAICKHAITPFGRLRIAKHYWPACFWLVFQKRLVTLYLSDVLSTLAKALSSIYHRKNIIKCYTLFYLERIIVLVYIASGNLQNPSLPISNGSFDVSFNIANRKQTQVKM